MSALRVPRFVVALALSGGLLSAACQSAAPAATPAATTAPAASVAPKPSAATSPVASPGASPVASPAAGAGSPAAPVAQSTAKIDPSLASVWQGKTVTLVVGANAGGGYDTWARLVARYLPKHLPGNPNMIVQNMDGAGHRVATNYIYAAKPDGMTIGMVDRYVPYFQLNGEGPEQGVRYDVTKLNWLGSVSISTQVLSVRTDSGVSASNLAPATSTTIRIAQQDPGNSPHAWETILREVLGWKLQPVFGFAGNPESALSLQRGETQGMITDWDTQARLLDEQFKSGQMAPLVQFGDLRSDPALKNVPMIKDLFEGKGDEAQALLNITGLPFQWSRPLMAPPGVDPKMVETLRAGMWEMMQDPEFLAEGQRLNLTIIPVPGEYVQTLMTQYMQSPQDVVKKLDGLMKQDVQ